jgi:hypothetical protein
MDEKIKYILIVALVFIGCKELSFHHPVNSYFPLKAGSIWKYRQPFDTSMAMMLYCSNYIEINDTVYAVLEERHYFRSRQWYFIRHFLRYDSSGSVIRLVQEPEVHLYNNYPYRPYIIPAVNSDYYLYNFYVELNKRYSVEKYRHPFDINNHRFTKVDMTLLSRNDTVTTPSGTFYNCYKYYLDELLCTDEECIDLLVPNVGLVERYTTQGPTGSDYILYSYFIPQ